MIKSYLKAPYWIIVNDDVAFGRGFLAEMYATTMRDPSLGIIHGFEGDHNVGSWDLFLLRDHIVADYGLFDENLYPAYNEDADYFLRFIHSPIRKMMNLQSDYYHGEGKKNEYHIHGSQTGKSDPVLKEKLDRVNLMNMDYMTHKWGKEWRWCAPSKLPFENRPISYTSYDLRFIRQKYLGF
jgi:GT2 family glycosyltransferase